MQAQIFLAGSWRGGGGGGGGGEDLNPRTVKCGSNFKLVGKT